MPRRKKVVDVDMEGGGKSSRMAGDIIPVADVSMLNIFEGSPVELSIDSYQDFLVYPSSFYNDNSPISFMINASEHFLDLHNMRVEIWFQIKKQDDGDLGE